MTKPRPSPEARALTALILEVFRLNGRLLAAGDRLVAPLGLSSARWQVLGAIHFAQEPRTVSWLARSMGLTRQGVQRLANELAAEGVVAFQPNPADRRAQLVSMTERGTALYGAAEALQAPWADSLAEGFDVPRLQGLLEDLSLLRSRLETASDVTP